MSTPDPASARAEPFESAAPARSAAAITAERWVTEHGDLLWRFARSRLRNPHLVEEAVQETLLAAMESFDRFSGASSERTWLLGIAAHKIADCLRRERREARAKGPPADDPIDAAPPEDPFTPRGKWKRVPRLWPRGNAPDAPDGPSAGERAELLAALAACLEKLPPGIAEAIWLRDLLEMPADQVCQALGLSATNLWTRTHRGRTALRSCVEESLQAGSVRVQRGSESAPSSPRPRDGGTRT